MLEGFSLGNYLLLVDFTARLFRDGKAVLSTEVTGIFNRLGSNADRWQTGLEKLKAAACSAGSSQTAETGYAKSPHT